MKTTSIQQNEWGFKHLKCGLDRNRMGNRHTIIIENIKTKTQCVTTKDRGFKYQKKWIITIKNRGLNQPKAAIE